MKTILILFLVYIFVNVVASFIDGIRVKEIDSPSESPVNSFEPSIEPSVVPSELIVTSSTPSVVPSGQPFATSSPSRVPSSPPTFRPTAGPTIRPTRSPTFGATQKPTNTPSPSVCPTFAPTVLPTTSIPTNLPIFVRTLGPTVVSRSPTAKPTVEPTFTVTSLIPTPIPTVLPSVKPTRAPTTFRPTQKTELPTVSLNAPVVKSIAIQSRSDSATLTVQFQSATYYAGMLYCGVFPSGTTIASTSQVISSGNSVAYPVNVTSRVMVFSGLSPLTDYEAYCYSKNSNGFENSLAQVRATKKSFSSACCRSVSFTNAPQFVYGDSSHYSLSDMSSYVFAFSLSARPSQDISVTPTFIVGGSTTPLVSASPNMLNFSSSSIRLSGTFVLNADKSFHSLGLLTLRLSGRSSHEFHTENVSVSILAVGAVGPPPSLVRAQYSDSGANIFISFSAPTDQGGILTPTFPCQLLFAFPSVNSLSCSWVNSSMARVDVVNTLGDISLPTAGQSIGLLANSIKAFCSTNSTACSSNEYAADQSVLLLNPVNAIIPVVVLLAPETVSSCDNVTLNAALSTGNGGRSFVSRQWTVTVDDESANSGDVAEFLNGFSVEQISNGELAIPNRLLVTAKYSFTLTLENYFGYSSSTTVAVEVSNNLNIPSLSIVGSNSWSMLSSDELVVYASASLSSCANSANMSFSWQLYLNNILVPSVKSISQDPSAYLLPPYMLASGRVYTLSVVATVPVSGEREAAVAVAKRDITVQLGGINAAIKGGSVLKVLSNSVVELDASISTDQNIGLVANSTKTDSSQSKLSFSWSCVIASSLNYGQSCDNAVIDVNLSNSSLLVVNGSDLHPSVLYSINVLVSSEDGRYDSASVLISLYSSISLMANQTASTFISSKVVKFNPETRLSLFGFVASKVDVDASWVVLSSNVVQNVSSLTPTVKHFESSIVSSSISFPLVVPENTFMAGSSLTFRLQLSSPDLLTYSEMSVEVNSPPIGGLLSVAPPSGAALDTLFSMFTSNWIDDPTDYPLTFSFTYSTASSSDVNQLYVKSRSTLSSISSKLSAGDANNDFIVYIIGRAFDSYMAYSQLVEEVTVTASTTDVAAYLEDQLNTAFSSCNVNLASNAINNAANSINVGDCSLANATYCASKNRQTCSANNLCGECSEGFFGISGSSNAKCLSDETSGLVGDACDSDDDCRYGNCTSSVCVEPILVCPSGSNGQVCSGQGACSYFDISGNLLDSQCGIFNQFCTASCVCSSGFGGSDCSLDAEAMTVRDNTRFRLCEGIVKVSNSSNPSIQLLQQLINSLSASFSPAEVLSKATYVECITALSSIAELAHSGYLVGAPSDISQNLILLASKFVSNSVSSNVEYSGDNSYADAITRILNGLEKAVASGQNSVSYASNNIRVSIRRDLTVDLVNSELEAPPSSTEASYGQYKSSKITLSPEVAALCDSGTGYAKLTMMQWNNNPYNNADLSSPVLRTDSKTCSRPSSRRLTDIWSNNSRTERNSDNSTLAGLFYITLQFASPQNFDFSIDPSNYVVYEGENTTFPECKVFDGTSFVPCSGCNISHYTNYNVTYACSDGAVLCGSCDEVSSTRALSHVDGNANYDDDSDSLIEQFYENVGKKRTMYATYSQRMTTPGESRRALQSLSGDDDGSTSGGKVTSGQFAAILGAVKTEIAVVLSFNPFSIDLEKAKPILIFVSILFIIIFGGFVYFIRWDRFDHNMMVYSNKMNVQQALMMKKAALDQQGSHYDDQKYQELKKFFEDKREKLLNRKRWMMNKKSKSFIAKRKCAVTGEVLEDDNSEKLSPITDVKFRDDNIGDDNTERDFLIAAKEVGYDSILDIPSVNEEFVATHNKFIINTVSAFLGYVIPIASAEVNKERFYHHIYNKHDYTSMFSDPSLFMNRTNRWINVCMQLMLGLFLDTIFFGMFFPDSGTCEALHSKSSCTGIMNKATNLPLCSWTEDYKEANTFTCSLNFPPNTVTFIVLVAMLTILFAVPVSFLYDYLRIKICARRPNFKHCLTCFEHGMQSSTKNAVNEENRHSTLHDLYDDINRKRSQDADYQMHLMSKTNEEYQQKALEEVNVLARKVYDGVTSSAEEVDQILAEVRLFLNQYVSSSTTPWNNTYSSEEIRAKATAIQRFIGVYPDGTPVPLSIWDMLWYGNAREKLRQKLLQSRAKARRISSHLNKMGDIEANNKDMSLIQFFILEQFDPVKRYALRYQFFNFPVSTPNDINGTVWLGTWFFLIGSLLFYLYWTLAWGVQSGGHTFRAWGLNFILSFVEDVCMIQLVKIYVLYVLAMFSIRPQLGYIYATLNKVAIKYAQEGPTEDKSIRVVQHLSASCRAARSVVCKELAAGRILSQIDDSDIRNCRKNGRTPLPAIAFLIVLLPAVLTLLFNDSFGEMVMSTILPSIFTIFIMLNYYIYSVHVIFLIIVWAIIAGFLYWRFYRHRRNLRRMKLAKDINVSIDVVVSENVIEMQRHSHQARLSNRSAVSASFTKYLLLTQEKFLDFCYLIVWAAFRPVSMFKKMNERSADKKSDLVWSHMNYPEELQGNSNFSVDHEKIVDTANISEIPFYIQNVLVSEWKSEEWSERVKSKYLTNLLNKYLLNVHEDDDVALSSPSPAKSVDNLARKQSMRPNSLKRLNSIHRDKMSNADGDEIERRSVVSESAPSVYTLDTLHTSNRPPSQNLRKPREARSTKVSKKIRTDPSWESAAGRNFRYNNTITTDEYVALKRMLLKHLGRRLNTHKSEKPLPELVAEYDDFNELIEVKVLTNIMRSIFDIYYPAGEKVDEEEMNGLMEDFTQWTETSRSIDSSGMVPYVVFQEWFLALNLKLIKYRAINEGFEAEEDIDYLLNVGMQDEDYGFDEDTVVDISVNIFASVIESFCSQVSSSVLADRDNAIDALCENFCDSVVNEVVKSCCFEIVRGEVNSIKDWIGDIGVDLVREVVVDTLEELWWPVGTKVMLQAIDDIVKDVAEEEVVNITTRTVEVQCMHEICNESVDDLLLDVCAEVYGEERIYDLEEYLVLSVIEEEVDQTCDEIAENVRSDLIASVSFDLSNQLLDDYTVEMLQGLTIESKLEHNGLIQSIALKVINEVVQEESALICSVQTFGVDRQIQKKFLQDRETEIWEAVLDEVVQSEVKLAFAKYKKEVMSIVELFARGEVIAEAVDVETKQIVIEALAETEDSRMALLATHAELLQSDLLSEEIVCIAQEVKCEESVEPVIAPKSPRYLVKTQSFMVKEKLKAVGKSVKEV